MTTHYKIRIHGKVQKVGFRYHAYVNAIRFKLTGFVTNEAEGSVYIEAEGEEDNLLAYLEWCKSGTEWSDVDSVDIKKGPVVHYTDFNIRH